ncbi:glutamic acid-rich protein-like [Helianthus annuus]|uniref:glutamic acid-rich protein-like n=1 Tax=Helianthus annuus TaxID=4232 RepID=UPI000B8FD147|nr:glutamic acid-rich protein-like [Helianthus annuus]
MKEASYADELKTLASFKETRNEWFLKEEKKKRSRKATPKVQKEEGSSSKPQKKRQKKVVETMLVDESEEEDEAVDEDSEKAIGENDGDDSSSSSSEEEIDETERAKRIKAEIGKEKKLKRKRKEDKDDELYNPSPEQIIESQTPPSSGGRKKASARKQVMSPQAARRKLIVRLPKRTLKTKSSQPPSPSPPPEPSPPQSPHKSPPKQPTPPPSPPPHFSPLHQSPPHLSPPHQTSIQEQPVVTSQQIFQTPPSTQPPVQTTPGSSGFRNFPNIPMNVNIGLDDIGDFDFANNEQKVEADQTEVDILKVKVVELEEEKARRDEQNKYFELKNKELEVVKAMKEHEIYMMNKVLENMLGKSVEQRFEEIEVEEVRARRPAEIDAQMKNKGKGVEGVSEIAERLIVPSSVSELPIQNPRPISVVSGIFEEDVLIDNVINDQEVVDEDNDEEDDDEEDDDEDKVDDADDVFSASSHSDDDDDDNGQGGTSVKVTEASNEENVDDFLHDDVNEEPEGAEGEGENYKYVDEVDNYDRVEVKDCTDEESVNEDTSNFPTLVEFFSQGNVDELRRKVSECLKDKNFDGTVKNAQKEERKKWFRKCNERKFKRPLKYYKRDRDVSL